MNRAMKYTSFLMTTACLLAYAPAWAAEEPESGVTAAGLPSITVYAPRTEKATQTDINLDLTPPQVPYSDSADYLRTVPGVTAGRMGGHGLEPVIRGQSQNQLNIQTEGAYTFGGCPNRMDPPASYTALESYDRITVVRGYQSVLNGPGGAGGSVLLERDKPVLGSEFSLHGDLSSGYESNGDTHATQAYAVGGTHQAYVRATASIKDAGNYEDGNGKTVRSAFSEKSTGVTFGLTPQNSHLQLSYDFHHVKDALYPGAGMDSPLEENQRFQGSFEHRFEQGMVRRVKASAYGSQVDHIMDNYSLRTRNTAPYSSVDSDSNTYGGSLKTDLSLSGQEVRTTLDLRRNNRLAIRRAGMMPTNVNMVQSLMWPDITLDEAGFAAETTWKPYKQGRLITGLRYDLVQVDYGRANETAAMTGLSANDLYQQYYGVTADNQTEHNVGGLVRLEHDASSSLTLFSSLSRSLRTADATERGLASFMVMNGVNASWVGNPSLDPEAHHQFELGADYHRKKWALGSSAYVNRVQDFILRDSARGQSDVLVNAPTATVYRNVDALLAGLEVHGNWDMLPTLSLSGDATYTYGSNLDDHMPLAQIPPLQGAMHLNWQALDALELGSSLRWAATQTRVDLDPLTGTGRDVQKTSGYAVLDLHATVTKLEPMTITAGVSNLFDVTYASHLNRSNISDPTEVQVNEPGRSFYLRGHVWF